MPDWNPNNPNIVGCEQNAVSLPGESVATVTAAPGPSVRGFQTFSPGQQASVRQTIRSTVAEDIDAIRVEAAMTDVKMQMVEVFEAGDEIPSNVTFAEYLPNAVTNGGSASGAVSTIDDDWEDWDDSSGITLNVLGDTTSIQYASSGFDTSKRVLNISASATIRVSGPNAQRFYMRLIGPGGELPWYEFSASPGAIRDGDATYVWLSVAQSLGEINPFTGLPWTGADVQGFDDGTYEVMVRNLDGAGTSTCRLDQSSLIVTYADENREAFGTLVASGASTAERVFAITDPDGNDWSKADATTYSVLFRTPIASILNGTTSPGSAPAPATLSFIQGDIAPGYTDYAVVGTKWSPGSDGTMGSYVAGTRPTGAVTATAAPTLPDRGTIPIVLDVASTGDASADSPVYGAALMLPVYDGVTVEQEITADANEEYLYLVAVLYIFAGEEPTEDLTVNVRRRSDDTLFGTGDVAAVDMLDASRLAGTSDWRKVIVPLGSTSAVVSSTQYYVEFTSSTPTSRPWIVQAVTGNPASVADDADVAPGTFGGSTDVATFDSTDYSAWDVPVAFVIGPDAPADLDAVAGYDSVNDVGVDCGPICVPYAEVSWSATSLTTEFLFYEIQRRDAWSLPWRTVALVDDEAVEEWVDYEVRAGGVESEYRIRVFRDDLISSDWSTAVAVTVNACGRGYVFSSNWSTARFAYPDVFGRAAEREYEWASTLVERRIYGRDGVVGFRPTERELVRFDRRLLTSAILAPDLGPGPEAFRAFRAFLIDGDLPYVTVRDGDGNRYFALVVAPEATVAQIGSASFHHIGIEVIEATEIPAIPTVST